VSEPNPTATLFKKDVFRTFNVDHRQEHEMLKESSSRRLRNDSERTKTRERKFIINPQKIREMKRILEEENIEARELT
jgi:hypothetical protein